MKNENSAEQINQNQSANQQQNSARQNPYYANTQQSNPYYNQPNGQSVPHSHTLTNWLGQTSSDRFIRGLVIGAAATYILTNEKAQKALIKTGMKLYGAVAGGVEEIKEKIMDAKAELEDGEE